MTSFTRKTCAVITDMLSREGVLLFGAAVMTVSVLTPLALLFATTTPHVAPSPLAVVFSGLMFFLGFFVFGSGILIHLDTKRLKDMDFCMRLNADTEARMTKAMRDLARVEEVPPQA